MVWGVSLLGDFTTGLNAANGDMGKIISEVIGSNIRICNSNINGKNYLEFLNYGIEIVSSVELGNNQLFHLIISAVTDIAMIITGKPRITA